MDDEHFRILEALGKYYLAIESGDPAASNIEKAGRPHVRTEPEGRVIEWPEWTHGSVSPPTPEQLQALDAQAARDFIKQYRARVLITDDKYARLFVRLIMRIENVSRAQAEAVVMNFLENE